MRPEASPEVEVVTSHPFFFWGGTVVFGVETYYVDMSDGNKKTQDVSEMDRLEESIKFMCGRALEKREAI